MITPTTFQLVRSSSHHAHPFSIKDNNNEIITLKKSEKVKAVTLGIFFGFLSLPLLIIGGPLVGYTVFVISSARYKKKRIKKHIDFQAYVINNQTLPLPPNAPPSPQAIRAEKEQRYRELCFNKSELQNARLPIPAEMEAEIGELCAFLYPPDPTLPPPPRNPPQTTEERRAALAEKRRARELGKAQRAAQEAAQKEALATRKANLKDNIRAYLQSDFMKNIKATPREVLNIIEEIIDEPPPQLPIPDDDAVLPPIPEQVKPGLLNPTKTTCWLNSTLKFLALTRWGDNFCNAQVDGEEARNIQVLLRKVLISLRTGEADHIVNEQLMSDFLISIAPLMGDASLPIPGNTERPEQQEAREIFLQLNALFRPYEQLIGNTQNNAAIEQNCQRTQATYRVDERAAQQQLYKSPSLDSYAPILEIRATSRHLLTQQQQNLVNSGRSVDTPMDLNELIACSEDDVQIRADQQRDSDGTLVPLENGPNINVQKNNCLVNAPQNLTVSLDRSVFIGDNYANVQGTARKCQKPIQMLQYQDDPYVIKLHEYDLNMSLEEINDRVNPLLPTSDCYYRIKGAILHLGATVNSGHYIYMQRAADGSFIIHDDSRTFSASPDIIESWLKNAISFELELISKEAYVAPPLPPVTQPAPRAQPAMQRRRRSPLSSNRADTPPFTLVVLEPTSGIPQPAVVVDNPQPGRSNPAGTEGTSNDQT